MAVKDAKGMSLAMGGTVSTNAFLKEELDCSLQYKGENDIYDSVQEFLSRIQGDIAENGGQIQKNFDDVFKSEFSRRAINRILAHMRANEPKNRANSLALWGVMKATSDVMRKRKMARKGLLRQQQQAQNMKKWGDGISDLLQRQQQDNSVDTDYGPYFLELQKLRDKYVAEAFNNSISGSGIRQNQLVQENWDLLSFLRKIKNNKFSDKVIATEKQLQYQCVIEGYLDLSKRTCKICEGLMHNSTDKGALDNSSKYTIEKIMSDKLGKMSGKKKISSNCPTFDKLKSLADSLHPSIGESITRAIYLAISQVQTEVYTGETKRRPGVYNGDTKIDKMWNPNIWRFKEKISTAAVPEVFSLLLSQFQTKRCYFCLGYGHQADRCNIKVIQRHSFSQWGGKTFTEEAIRELEQDSKCIKKYKIKVKVFGAEDSDDNERNDDDGSQTMASGGAGGGTIAGGGTMGSNPVD